MTFKILCCDGGGIRGLVTALLIKDLDTHVKDFVANADGFAGTSTGGLIALGLAHGKSIDDIRIPKPVDVIFICNTYHHISDRPSYFRRCRAMLRSGGRIVSVDWEKRKVDVGPPPDHKLAAGVCIEEMAEAGYRLAKRDDSLPYQYVLVFEPDDAVLSP